MRLALHRYTTLLLTTRVAAMTTAASKPSRFRSWPITEVSALEPSLKAMGLRVPAKEIDGTSTSAACLSDALVSVGPAGRGGTGSFISSSGLIITNHHVALDAVRRASSEGQDLLNDGFVAKSREDEIPDADYEVWITRSCLDVSDKLADVRSEADPLKRANKVRDRRQELAREAEAAAAGPASSVRCEVQEMWPDRTYVLFTYERLRGTMPASGAPTPGLAQRSGWPAALTRSCPALGQTCASCTCRPSRSAASAATRTTSSGPATRPTSRCSARTSRPTAPPPSTRPTTCRTSRRSSCAPRPVRGACRPHPSEAPLTL